VRPEICSGVCCQSEQSASMSAAPVQKQPHQDCCLCMSRVRTGTILDGWPLLGRHTQNIISHSPIIIEQISKAPEPVEWVSTRQVCPCGCLRFT